MTEAAGASGGHWTPTSLLQWTEGFFRGKGIDSPRLDAEVLLAHVLGCPRINLYLQFDRPLTPDELARYRELVRARAARTPVAYLVGSVGFWKLTLAIRPGCLIPRPDTETLVEAAVAAASTLRARLGDAAGPLTVLELGTGSGAIPLAVCSELNQVTWIGVERTPEAMAVAAENRARHAELLGPRGNALHLVRGDRFTALAPGFAPHLIVSNPPYIPSGDIATLMPEVAEAEPRAALDGGPDGLDFHRALLDEAARRLAPDGRILMEMGHDQGSALTTELTKRPALRQVAIHKDLAGRERVFEAERA